MTLTARQEAVLGAVVRLREAAGYGPSLREIAAETRLSVSRVRQHLLALETRGRIARDLATARSIRIITAGAAAQCETASVRPEQPAVARSAIA